jgi:hypothetical protein
MLSAKRHPLGYVLHSSSESILVFKTAQELFDFFAAHFPGEILQVNLT